MAEPLDREMPIAPVGSDRAARNHEAKQRVGVGAANDAAAINCATARNDADDPGGLAADPVAVSASAAPTGGSIATTISGVFLPILMILYLLGFMNLFLRGSFGVMAPDLSREMNLSPAMLSTIASSFFFAYALMQVPTGMLLDRFGARLTLGTMLLFTTAGAALFAVGQTPEMLSAGRVLMGIGCAGVFTGAFYVLALWLPPDRLVTQIGTLNGFASFGQLCATVPFAALIAWIGWRESYWIFTAAVGLITIAVALVMRDAPPGRPPLAAKEEGLVQIFGGVREAVRQPGVKRLLFAGLPMSASTTIAGAWGAPYLKHVHGIDDIGRGSILLMMAVASMCGHVLYGQIARRLNTLKWMIIGGGSLGLMGTSLMAALDHPPVQLVTGLFCLIALAGAFPTIIHSHARGLVPAHLIGRGVSVTNMGIMVAIATVQLAFGWIVGLFTDAGGVPPEHAFRVAFAAQATAALAGLLIFAPVRDVKPRG